MIFFCFLFDNLEIAMLMMMINDDDASDDNHN